jgi:hypothetical protein
MRSLMLMAVLLLSTPCALRAEEANDGQEQEQAPTVISPIFGQLVMFTLPVGFRTVFEQPSAASYIREAVLKGETVDHWSQMVTVTGAKGLASQPEASAQQFAAQIAAGIQKACPQTFQVKPLGPSSVSGHEAFAAVASCGKVDASADKHSETALIVAIKGAEDLYTVQWAERTAANAENLTIDEAKWKDRLAKLSPLRLCPIEPGETAPYPSCVSKTE